MSSEPKTFCRGCARRIDPEAVACPSCGRAQEHAAPIWRRSEAKAVPDVPPTPVERERIAAERGRIGRGLAVSGGIVVVLSLFLTWYTTGDGSTGDITDLKSAWQWFSGFATYVLLMGVSGIVLGIVHGYRHGLGRYVERYVRFGAVAYFGLCAALVLYHVISPPAFSPATDPSTGEVIVFPTTRSIGVFIALAGSLAMLAGAWMITRWTAAPPAKKRCPQCAETVQPDARVCKHCGHRFDAPPAPADEV